MNFHYPEINCVFDTENAYINTIVIENGPLLYRLLTDVDSQIKGDDGKSVLSENNVPLNMGKCMECISQFVPFQINSKSIINKAISKLESLVTRGEQYERFMNIKGQLEAALYDVSFDMVGDIEFTKLDLPSILRATGLEFAEEYDSLGEKIVDYMELVKEYDRSKLFLLVNLRSYMDDHEMELFMETILQHQFHVIMVERFSSTKLSLEKRYIIDQDLCEIGE